MIVTWEMVVCHGLFMGICSSITVSPYPDEDSCYRALKNVQAQGKSAFSLCRTRIIIPPNKESDAGRRP